MIVLWRKLNRSVYYSDLNNTESGFPLFSVNRAEGGGGDQSRGKNGLGDIGRSHGKWSRERRGEVWFLILQHFLRGYRCFFPDLHWALLRILRAAPRDRN